jgi:hypothetical protein
MSASREVPKRSIVVCHNLFCTEMLMVKRRMRIGRAWFGATHLPPG